MTTTISPTKPVLTDEMLARFDARAPVYDRENRFFQEDFEELRESSVSQGILEILIIGQVDSVHVSVLLIEEPAVEWVLIEHGVECCFVEDCHEDACQGTFTK